MRQTVEKYYRYIFFLIIASFLVWYQTELGSVYETVTQCFMIEWKYIVLNVFTLFIMMGILGIVLNSMGVACIVVDIILGSVSLINYHVVAYRGLPLTILDIVNIKMAVDIGKSYKIIWDEMTDLILLCMILVWILGGVIFWYEKKNNIKWRKISLFDFLFLLVSGIFIYCGYLSPNPIKTKETIGWSWTEAYHQYGYLACTLEAASQMKRVVRQPFGYDERKITEIEIEQKETSNDEKPDIILILNETFYDLSEILELETDTDYLKNIHQMENLLEGKAVVPVNGGGTNKSEYELLTSNSMELMNTSSADPFNILQLKGANSIVSILKKNGYQTLAAHSEPGVNYSRAKAYPDLGFDYVHFNEDFTKEYYGDRWYATDESLYKNLIEWYEDMGEDPRFLYLLTVQNHGDWEMNKEELDTVHVLNDYGDYTDRINEYLSCIALTDQAFSFLTSYYSKVDRPVIICIVGDHAPVFAADIIDERYDEMESARMLRSVPLYIWSNFDLPDMNPNTISMNYVSPLLLRLAGFNNLSYYYEYMLNMREAVPVISSYDVYIDSAGVEYPYTSESPYTDMVNTYLYMEYNNLQSDRRQELFE